MERKVRSWKKVENEYMHYNRKVNVPVGNKTFPAWLFSWMQLDVTAAIVECSFLFRPDTAVF